MPAVEIGAIETVEAKAVSFSAFGVDWQATFLPEGDSLSVIVRHAAGRVALVATSLPLESIEDEDDLTYVLSIPEVGFSLHEVAEHENLEGFDDKAYREAGLSIVVCREMPDGKGLRVDYASDGAVGLGLQQGGFKEYGDPSNGNRISTHENGGE